MSIEKVYRKNGQLGEAEALRKNIKTAKRALKKGHGSYDPVNYDQPSEKMIQDAKQFGIDLTDPRVVKELNRMEQARREGKDVEAMLREDAKTHADLEAEAKRNLAKQNMPKKELSFKKVFAFTFTVLLGWRLLDMGLLPAMIPITAHFLPERFTRPVPAGFAKLIGIATEDVAQTHETMDSWDDEF